MLWTSFERDINKLREHKLGLEPLRAGQGGCNLLNIQKVALRKHVYRAQAHIYCSFSLIHATSLYFFVRVKTRLTGY